MRLVLLPAARAGASGNDGEVPESGLGPKRRPQKGRCCEPGVNGVSGSDRRRPEHRSAGRTPVHLGSLSESSGAAMSPSAARSEQRADLERSLGVELWRG